MERASVSVGSTKPRARGGVLCYTPSNGYVWEGVAFTLELR